MMYEFRDEKKISSLPAYSQGSSDFPLRDTTRLREVDEWRKYHNSIHGFQICRRDVVKLILQDTPCKCKVTGMEWSGGYIIGISSNKFG